MGNHSETAELLQEASELVLTEKNTYFGDTLIDEHGNTIKLDQSPEELQPVNPTKLKDSIGRDIDLIQNKAPTGMLTPKQAEALEAKLKKKKTS